MTESVLAELAQHYLEAKAAEAQWAEIRRHLAAQIQAVTGWTEEGSKTFKDGDWKIVVKQPMTRSMDWKKWNAEVKQQIPEALWPVEMKPSLDEKGVKWLAANEPDLYALLAQSLTVKPGAVQVTVETLEPEAA